MFVLLTLRAADINIQLDFIAYKYISPRIDFYFMAGILLRIICIRFSDCMGSLMAIRCLVNSLSMQIFIILHNVS